MNTAENADFGKQGIEIQVVSLAYKSNSDYMENKMYIRLIRKNEVDSQGQELLINLDHITKIEVNYYVPNPAQIHENIFTPRTAANLDPTSKRTYTIYLGSEKFFLPSCPGNPAMDVIEEIYKNSIAY